MSDRIYVMSEGRATGELRTEEATQEAIKMVTTLTMKVISQSIEFIRTPDAVVTDTDHISEFLEQCDANTYNAIKDYNAKLKESTEIKLEEAEVVISGGRGMGGPEGFEILKELATELGAAVGASRPPCDAGWVPSSYQVGITGKVISPPVYMAVGISGAAQHLSGMGDSKKIIAINKDEEAEIFKVADYGAVGDYKEVIPAFLEVIKSKKGA